MTQRSKATGRFEMKAGSFVDSKGYPRLTAGPLRGMRIHILVAIAKFGYDAVKKRDVVVHHKNDNKLDPHPDNLELKTEKEHNAVSAKQYWYLKENIWPEEKRAWDEYHNSSQPPVCHESH
jgi:hypothetical protein